MLNEYLFEEIVRGARVLWWGADIVLTADDKRRIWDERLRRSRNRTKVSAGNDPRSRAG